MFRPWNTTLVLALPAAPPWTLARARIKRTARVLYMNVRDTDSEMPPVGGGRVLDEASLPLVITTMLREEGITGVHTHVRQLRRYLEECGTTAPLVTPFSWGRALTYPFSASAARSGAMQPIR